MSDKAIFVTTGFGSPPAAPVEAGGDDGEVRMTPAAASKVFQLIESSGRSEPLLRVFIEGGGCSGFQYGFEFDDVVADDDVVVERDGAKLLVDSMSIHYLGGAEVDYLEDLQGARFVVRNPNATTTCGCGSSFAI